MSLQISLVPIYDIASVAKRSSISDVSQRRSLRYCGIAYAGKHSLVSLPSNLALTALQACQHFLYILFFAVCLSALKPEICFTVGPVSVFTRS